MLTVLVSTAIRYRWASPVALHPHCTAEYLGTYNNIHKARPYSGDAASTGLGLGLGICISRTLLRGLSCTAWIKTYQVRWPPPVPILAPGLPCAVGKTPSLAPPQ